MKSAHDLLAEVGVRLRSYAQGQHRGSCPRCDATKPRISDDALAVGIDEIGFRLICHRCGWEAFGFYDRATAVSNGPAPAKRADNIATEVKIRRALMLARESVEITGTPAETYLRSRGITCALPRCLRFHATCWHGELKQHAPAMVAVMRDAETNEPCGVHRTFLAPDGSGKITTGKAKMMMGRAKRAAIKLTPNAEVTLGLGICEGIETGLSLISIGYRVWAVGSAGAIEDFPVLAGIEALTIFADHDGVGLEAARTCARRWADAGKEALIMSPKAVGADWNDWIQRAA